MSINDLFIRREPAYYTKGASTRRWHVACGMPRATPLENELTETYKTFYTEVAWHVAMCYVRPACHAKIRFFEGATATSDSVVRSFTTKVIII